MLITDGVDENSSLNLEDGLRVAQDAQIPVFAIGVGQARERVLRRIAKLTGGEYFAVDRIGAGALAALIQAAPATPAATLSAPERQPGSPATASPAAATPGGGRPGARSRALLAVWLLLCWPWRRRSPTSAPAAAHRPTSPRLRPTPRCRRTSPTPCCSG